MGFVPQAVSVYRVAGGAAIVEENLTIAPGLVLIGNDVVLQIADLFSFPERGLLSCLIVDSYSSTSYMPRLDGLSISFRVNSHTPFITSIHGNPNTMPSILSMRSDSLSCFLSAIAVMRAFDHTLTRGISVSSDLWTVDRAQGRRFSTNVLGAQYGLYSQLCLLASVKGSSTISPQRCG